jgi:hypothetical protein
MAEDTSPKFSDVLSVQEMQGWLKDEVRDSAKAHELRTKEATEFVTAYSEGKLTPAEAMDRLVQYDRRWGEALFGTSAFPNLSDEELLKKIDAARQEVLDPGSFTNRIKSSIAPKR